MQVNNIELHDFLNEKADQYERPEFIKEDPIQVPHAFTQKEDIEIMAFLTATIAWGQRPTIIKNAKRIADLLDGTPHAFITKHGNEEQDHLAGFVHRTFNATDFAYFIKALHHIYKEHDGLEALFTRAFVEHKNAANAIHAFRKVFFEVAHPSRTEKHVSNPLKGSSAKRLNMFLRWMVRSNKRGVDFGLWQDIEPAWLSVPLDVHTGNVARQLGLLKRKQNDQKAVQELDIRLRMFDPEDPVRYDLALFGLGVYEGF